MYLSNLRRVASRSPNIMIRSREKKLSITNLHLPWQPTKDVSPTSMMVGTTKAWMMMKLQAYITYHTSHIPFHNSHSALLLTFCQRLQAPQWPAPQWSCGCKSERCHLGSNHSAQSLLFVLYGLQRTLETTIMGLVIPWSPIVSQCLLLLLCIACKFCRCLAPYLVVAFTWATSLISLCCALNGLWSVSEYKCVVYPCVVICVLALQVFVCAITFSSTIVCTRRWMSL